MLRATVSGSFRRHMGAIHEAVTELGELHVRVLSPADPTPVSQHDDFIFVASDKVRSIRLVQDRHLEAIRASDFLWLVCPDGYVGQSASMELGFAAACGTPIFSDRPPSDTTLRSYVRCVETLRSTVIALKAQGDPEHRPEGFLLDPLNAIEKAHTGLEYLRTMMRIASPSASEQTGVRILQVRDSLGKLLLG